MKNRKDETGKTSKKSGVSINNPTEKPTASAPIRKDNAEDSQQTAKRFGRWNSFGQFILGE